MSKSAAPRAVVPLFLMMLALPTALLAADPEPNRASDSDPSTMVILGDDGQEITLTVDNGTMTMISTEDGRTSTRIVDLEALGLLAADAMDVALVEIDDVFAQLQDMQFQFRMGNDNRLNLSCGDSELELDLDQVMAQVASAVHLGLQEIDTAEWGSHTRRRDEASDEDLQAELESLKDEMQELRRELRRLQQEERNR